MCLEVQCAPLFPRTAQHVVKPVEPIDFFTPLGGHTGTPAFFDDFADVGVGQPGVGMNHRLIENVVLQLSAVINLHLADHGQAVHLWL